MFLDAKISCESLHFLWLFSSIFKKGTGVVAMDPEISSCPDSPERDPSLEFCNDWEEPRDLLLKAGV